MSYFIVYQGPINHDGAKNLQTLVVSALREGIKELTICMCSGGGDVTSGIGLYNFLRSVPATIKIHNMGICGSIAATIYLAGKHRTSADTSVFTLHAATYINGPRKGEVCENTALISKPFRLELNWDVKRIDEYFSDQTEKFIEPTIARDMGMVHEIINLQIPGGATILTVNVPN